MQDLGFKAMASFVILNIPEGVEKTKVLGKDGVMVTLEHPELKIKGVPLTVLSVGDTVPDTSVKVGDEILLFKEKVTVITIKEVKYILIQWFDIEVKIEAAAGAPLLITS